MKEPLVNPAGHRPPVPAARPVTPQCIANVTEAPVSFLREFGPEL